MNKILSIQVSNIKRLLDEICKTGFDKEKDVIKQKLIYTCNAICLLCFLVCTVLSILKFFIVGNYIESGITLVAGFFLLLFIYFNKWGISLLGRILMPLLANLILLIISILFTHESYLDIYFIFICNTTLQLFDYSERKWAYFCIGISIVCLLFETTALQNFLPSYNMISAQELPRMNTVLIVGIVIFAIIQARIFVLVRRFKEADLKTTQSTLRISQDDLKIQNDDLEAFGIAVTHDLKAPISIAHLYLNLINRHIQKNYSSDSHLNEFVETVHTSLGQMERVILAYLSFNKVKSQTIDGERFDVNQELATLVKDYLNRVVGTDVILPEDEIQLHCNKYLFSTIMKNLIENGLKYNKSQHPQVVINATVMPQSIIFTIKDNGIGIDPKFNKYLFKPFKRFNTEIEGSGLGLAAAKRASEKLHATLQCQTSGEAGTVFVFEIFN